MSFKRKRRPGFAAMSVPSGADAHAEWLAFMSSCDLGHQKGDNLKGRTNSVGSEHHENGNAFTGLWYKRATPGVPGCTAVACRRCIYLQAQAAVTGFRTAVPDQPSLTYLARYSYR